MAVIAVYRHAIRRAMRLPTETNLLVGARQGGSLGGHQAEWLPSMGRNAST
jgi:hypothetical protein